MKNENAKKELDLLKKVGNKIENKIENLVENEVKKAAKEVENIEKNE